MSYQGTDRRQCTALRNHIDGLLADGASLIGRDPVRLIYKQQTLAVQHGMLLSEPTPSELIDALNVLVEGEDGARAAAIEICLRYLDSALAPYPPFRYRTHELNGNAAVAGSFYEDQECQ